MTNCGTVRDPRSSRHLNFAGHDGNHFIDLRVADDAHRVFAVLHRLDAFPEHAAQLNHAFVGDAEMLAAAIEDRSLAFLRAAVLIAAGGPAGLLVPAILAENAIAQTFGRLIFGYFRGHFTIDDWRKVMGEMHRVGV